jgi:transposase-like protein
MMIFPIKDLLSEQECYQFLLRVLHPNGLSCPCGRTIEDSQRPHTSDRAPIVEYKCRSCGKVFNVFTGTMWSKSYYDCRTITLLIRGFTQGVPSLHLAKELGLDYEAVLNRRHRWQEQALKKVVTPLPDQETESDEMFQNAGEKGQKHRDPEDPPRRRANKRRGIGTMENDRPPIHGVVGRESGQIRLTVCDNTQQKTIQPKVEEATREESLID